MPLSRPGGRGVDPTVEPSFTDFGHTRFHPKTKQLHGHETFILASLASRRSIEISGAVPFRPRASDPATMVGQNWCST